MALQNGMFTDREITQLVQATLKGHPDGVSEDSLVQMLEWATEQRIGAAMVTMAIAGKLALHVGSDGEVAAIHLEGAVHVRR